MAGMDAEGFTQIANQSNEGLLGGAKGLLVKFFRGTVQDPVESAKAGYPKHRAVEMIRIIVPGDRDNIVEREVLPIDLQRFESIYSRWKAQGDGPEMDGLPLTAWPSMDAALAEDLRYWKIYTVEQLAALPDNLLQKIGPLHEWRKKAQNFLAAAKDNAVLERFQADAKSKDAEIASLKEMVARLNEKLEDFVTKPGKNSRL